MEFPTRKPGEKDPPECPDRASGDRLKCRAPLRLMQIVQPSLRGDYKLSFGTKIWNDNGLIPRQTNAPGLAGLPEPWIIFTEGKK